MACRMFVFLFCLLGASQVLGNSAGSLIPGASSSGGDLVLLEGMLQTAVGGALSPPEVDKMHFLLDQMEQRIKQELTEGQNGLKEKELDLLTEEENEKIRLAEMEQGLARYKSDYERRESEREAYLKLIAKMRALVLAMMAQQAEAKKETTTTTSTTTAAPTPTTTTSTTTAPPATLGDTRELAAVSCKAIFLSKTHHGDGTYWIDTDGGSHDNAFQAFCDMTSDGGGWTLLISLAATTSTQHFASVDDWPDTFATTAKDLQDPEQTGLFKGSLKPFMEVREEIASGKMIAYGSNMTNADMTVVRSQYGWQDRVDAAPWANNRPNCRLQYQAPKDDIVGCYSTAQNTKNGVLKNTKAVIGWSVDANKGETCWFGRGDNAQASHGSSGCPGEPDGTHWARVWFR